MTDRELLELAAKSIGLKYRPENNYVVVDAKTGQWLGSWNPLADDGDALRLAVKLEIDLIIGTGHKFVTARNEVTQLNEYEYTQDKYAATRRAITRAAAEIGKAMP
jgi:hypothetical protein